jgi:B12-binding domain/radical SAM domain protein
MQVRVISPGIYTYGAMVIGGVIREGGHSVSIHRELTTAPCDVVFLSLFSTQHILNEKIKFYIASIRSAGTRCYIGGPVSADPKIVLEELLPDAVVIGEGEPVVLNLLSRGTPEGVSGTAYTKDGAMIIVPPKVPVSIERPLPLIPGDIGLQNIRGANVYIETHRGCLGSCSFCQVPRFFGRTIRSREIDDIRREVKSFKASGVHRISVSGGTGSLYQYRNGKLDSNAFIEMLHALAEEMGARNVSAPDIRADCINDEILEAIKQYTIGWVFFGIESGSDRILRQMGKGISSKQMIEAIEACREHDLKVAGSFIVGYPTEEEEDYNATKHFITEHVLDDIFISIAEPIPSTPLASLALKTPKEKNPVYTPHNGEYRPLGLTKAEAWHFDLSIHAATSRSRPFLVSGSLYDSYLEETKKQGREIRAVMDLLIRYYDGDSGSSATPFSTEI